MQKRREIRVFDPVYIWTNKLTIYQAFEAESYTGYMYIATDLQ